MNNVKCDLAGCTNSITRKAFFTDKETGEIESAYYCENDYKEAYDLRGLGMKVIVIRLTKQEKSK